ncbi:MAG: DUF5683 domain-containing protein [Bacteroidota bacterium]
MEPLLELSTPLAWKRLARARPYPDLSRWLSGSYRDYRGKGTPQKRVMLPHIMHTAVWFFVLTVLCSFSLHAQDNSEETIVVQDTVRTQKKAIDPLSPSRAAFYSALLPGLGQAYNKKYWKIPIVYAAIGTGVYFYISNTNFYNQYRDAYKSRLAGFTTDEFYDIDGSGVIPGNPDISDSALQDAQEFYQRNRDLSLLITVGLYALNIIDANVDAHLRQYNIDEDLTIRPVFERNQMDFNIYSGISLTYTF